MKMLNTSKHISKYVTHAYDAIWAMALSLRKVQHFYFDGILKQFTYRRRDMVDDFLFAMSSLSFTGMSVRLKQYFFEPNILYLLLNL